MEVLKRFPERGDHCKPADEWSGRLDLVLASCPKPHPGHGQRTVVMPTVAATALALLALAVDPAGALCPYAARHGSDSKPPTGHPQFDSHKKLAADYAAALAELDLARL